MNPEQFLSVGPDDHPAELCLQTFGSPTDPAILLIHGAGASMLWWEDELCSRLAEGGRYVIRFDNRDTGRSSYCPPGAPDYALSHLVSDAIAILDELGVRRAHVVGRSMAGGTALSLAVDHPERVATVTFVTTTTGDLEMGEVDFPPAPDWADPVAVMDHIAAAMAAYAGDSAHFDPEAARLLAEQDVQRSRSIASALVNHFLIDFDAPREGGFGDIGVPALVVHGEVDPVFPLEHGRALAAAVPSAGLLVLPATGHEVPRATWDLFVPALLDHTS